MTYVEPLEDDFCDIIVKAMRGYKLDAASLAWRLDVAVTEVKAWCAGQSLPDAGKLERMAAILGLAAPCLSDSAHKRWHPAVALPTGITRYLQAPYGSNGYLVHDEKTYISIDPAGDIEAKVRDLEEVEATLSAILITHRHDDHCNAALLLQKKYPAAPIYMYPIESEAVPELTHTASAIANKQILRFGALSIQVLLIPGHTDGLCAFLVQGNIFVGDALFAGSIGRNFGPASTYVQQIQVLRQLLGTLDPQTIILAGHGPPTNVKNELRQNPFLYHPDT